MRRNFYVFVILVLVFVGSGCASNKTRVGEGAGIGGIICRGLIFELTVAYFY